MWFVCYIRCFLCLYLSFDNMACMAHSLFLSLCISISLTNNATNEWMRWNLVDSIAAFICVFFRFQIYILLFFTTCERFFLLSFVHSIFTFDLVVCVCMLFKSHSLLKYKVCSNKHVARLHFFCVLDFHCLSLFISTAFTLCDTIGSTPRAYIVQTNKETQIQLAQKHLNSIQTHFIIMGVL